MSDPTTLTARVSTATGDATVSGDDLRDRVTALVPDECWVTRSTSDLRCTAMIGGGFKNGAKWTEDMCCLPCRLRAVLAASPVSVVSRPEATVRTIGDVWAEHGHPNVPCSPPDAAWDQPAVPCLIHLGAVSLAAVPEAGEPGE